MRKKYMIRCDIEGVSGVVSYEQAEPGRAEYEFGRRMFMSDLMAVIEGLNAGGADEIVIYDEHYYGRNIEIEKLPVNTCAICGKPPYRNDWAGGLDESFAGLILLGFHSKYGTPGGLLHHSYEPDIKDIRINGLSVGEIGMEAFIAGDYDVPLLLVCGDSAGVSEARSLVDDIACVTVKESVNEWGGLCYPSSLTKARIFEAAKGVVEKGYRTRSLKAEKSITFEVELNEGAYLDALKHLYKEDMTNGNTILIKGNAATEVWAEYWDRKLKAQKRMRD